MEPQNRREFLAAMAAAPLGIRAISQGRGGQAAASTGMFVSIHQASTARFDFKASCEGISKAGVRAVEVDIAKIQQFAQTESLPKAKQLLDGSRTRGPCPRATILDSWMHRRSSSPCCSIS
jgi:hypothetical protein